MNLLVVILLSIYELSDVSFAVRKNPGGHIPRNLGSSEARIEDHPYQAQLHFNGKFHCAGTILNRKTILTAAHCLKGAMIMWTVSVGSAQMYRGENHTIYSLAIHPKFALWSDGRTVIVRYNVAVLKLTGKLKYSNNIRPIRLQPKSQPVPAGTKAILTGWGAMGEINPNSLQKVELEVITNEACTESKMQGIFGEQNDWLCIKGITGRGGCYVDDGGPLAAGDHLIGVTSFMMSCGSPSLSGVFANVSYLYDFIVKHL